MRGLVAITIVLGGCTSLDGLSGGQRDGGTASVADGGPTQEGGLTTIVPLVDGGSDASTVPNDAAFTTARPCDTPTNPAAICSDFNNANTDLMTSGWTVTANTGSFKSVSGAVEFTFPNSGAASSLGPQFSKQFSGPWNSVACSFRVAFDEIPTNGTTDFFNLLTNPNDEEIALRLYANRITIVSCRNSSECKPERPVGMPDVGVFHDHRLTWSRDGRLTYARDDMIQAEIDLDLDDPSNLSARFGLLYRVYGEGGAFRARFDYVRCDLTQ